MRAFRVTLNVSNCLRQSGDDLFRLNCAVLCDVDAADSAGAEAAAIEVIRDCHDLHAALANEPDDSPLIEVEHVDPLDSIRLQEPDLAWYAPEE